MIRQGDMHFYWPDTNASSPKQSRGWLASVEGELKSLSHEKNHVITIIVTYPLNLENIFIIYLLLGYNIGLHVYSETNHLAKYHSSIFLSPVSAGIVAQ